MEDEIDVTVLVRRARLRRRHVLLEEAEVRDVAIALNEPVFVEDVARIDVELIADARLDGHVVAEDVDAIDDRRRLLVDIPTEIDRRYRVFADAAAFDNRA